MWSPSLKSSVRRTPSFGGWSIIQMKRNHFTPASISLLMTEEYWINCKPENHQLLFPSRFSTTNGLTANTVDHSVSFGLSINCFQRKVSLVCSLTNPFSSSASLVHWIRISWIDSSCFSLVVSSCSVSARRLRSFAAVFQFRVENLRSEVHSSFLRNILLLDTLRSDLKRLSVNVNNYWLFIRKNRIPLIIQRMVTISTERILSAVFNDSPSVVISYRKYLVIFLRLS
jgi:hypothetical protein